MRGAAGAVRARFVPWVYRMRGAASAVRARARATRLCCVACGTLRFCAAAINHVRPFSCRQVAGSILKQTGVDPTLPSAGFWASGKLGRSCSLFGRRVACYSNQSDLVFLGYWELRFESLGLQGELGFWSAQGCIGLSWGTFSKIFNPEPFIRCGMFLLFKPCLNRVGPYLRSCLGLGYRV